MPVPLPGRRSRAIAVGWVAAPALVAAGCTAGTADTASTSAPPSNSRIGCAAQGQVLGTGSSAQKAAMDVWIHAYTTACPSVQVAYFSRGSVSGVSQFLRGANAFGGSDGALTKEQISESTAQCHNGHAIDLPMVGGPIAVGYNLPGVKGLVLDAPTLAQIFDSRIRTWDDPAIRKLNPGLDLPPLEIRPFHRSDGSGTTQNFSTYLSAAAGSSWPYQPSSAWLGRDGESAPGSDELADAVKRNQGAISYFELSYAATNAIDSVRIATGAAHPVPPTTATASAGIAAAKVIGKGKDLTLRLGYGTKAEGAYPIVLVTYELVCDHGNPAATLPALKSFLTYTASDDGQRLLATAHYAPLPDRIAQRVRAVIPTLS